MFKHGWRLRVIDLPSVDRHARPLAVSALLSGLWKDVQYAWSMAMQDKATEDTRVPTFLIVDEAHNLIPAQQKSRVEDAIREQFRTVVAEGRKFGLFLIIVTQRPDKIDPFVLSECENAAIMRLGNTSTLATTRDLLGLGHISTMKLDSCLQFRRGRALLTGRWSPESDLLYTAARRTVAGGGGLLSDAWV
jgi:hypothetical protein